MKFSRFSLLPLSLCLALAAASPAAAHITFSKADLAAGSRYQVTSFRISHGCSGSPTVSIRMEIPDGVTARPEAKAGWTVTTEKKPLATPITSEGRTITDRVSAITWTGRLADDQFDEFGLMLNLPKDAGTLYFPAQQVCEVGKRDWTDIPAPGQDPHSVPNPAPTLTLSAGADPHAGHAGH